MRTSILVILLLLGGAARADSVVLTNGRAMTGTIVKETKDAVVLAVSGLGKMTIERSRIREILRDGAPPPEERPRPPSGRAPLPGPRPGTPRAAPSPRPVGPAPRGPGAEILAEYRRGLPRGENVSNEYVWDFIHRFEKVGRAATPVLSHALRDAADWRVRFFAARCLTEVADAAGAPALVHALDDPFLGRYTTAYSATSSRYAVRDAATKGLRRLGEAAHSVIRTIAVDPNHGDQVQAVRALRELKVPGRVPLMVRLARQRDQRLAVRHEAIDGLAKEEGEASRALVELLPEPAVRERVASALRSSRDRSTIEPLMAYVRQAARVPELAQDAANAILFADISWRPAGSNDCVDYMMLTHQPARLRREMGARAVPRLRQWISSGPDAMRAKAQKILSGFPAAGGR